MLNRKQQWRIRCCLLILFTEFNVPLRNPFTFLRVMAIFLPQFPVNPARNPGAHCLNSRRILPEIPVNRAPKPVLAHFVIQIDWSFRPSEGHA